MSKHILLIGVGGTGSHAVDLLYQKVRELGNQAGNKLVAIVFDTDTADIKDITAATAIPLADSRSLGKVVESLDPRFLEDFFPCYTGEEAIRLGKEDGSNYLHQELFKGASQWRKKSYLAFMNLMANRDKRAAFEGAIEKLMADGGSDALYEIYTVASLAGGTGSGSFIPITLYAKKYMKRFGAEARTHAMLACPDIYEKSLSKDQDQVTKVYANAYAILRELNAMNQVAFGNNKPSIGGAQTAPIRFKLGSEDNPYLGLLFDSEREEYWTPSAIPFHKIYLLDKLVGLSSVKAHDGIMASALYTLLCTDIGLAFDTTDSNLEAVRSAADRHNAVYAGVSAAELRYPLDDVVDFMAHKEAEEAAAGQWTAIARDVEEAIDGKRKAVLEQGKPFMLKDGEYASEVITATDNVLRMDTVPGLPYLLRRGLYNVVQNGDKAEYVEYLAPYITSLKRYFKEQLICDAATALKNITPKDMSKKLGLFASADDKEAERVNFVNLLDKVYANLAEYYRNAVEVIRSRHRSLSDAILPLGSDKDVLANKELSLVYNLLSKNGKYIHPVSAYVQLCKLKLALKAETAGCTEWDCLSSYDDNFVIPTDFLKTKDPVPAGDDAKLSLKNSQYAAAAEDRLDIFRQLGPDGYKAKKSDVYADSAVLVKDAEELAEALFAEAEKQLKCKVFATIEKRVDILIDQYRDFFRSFEEGRKNLVLDTERALTANEGAEDVIYVGASAEDKLAAYKDYQGSRDFSEADLIDMDHTAGKSVFDLAHAKGKAVVNEEAASEIGTAGLFSSLVEAYTALIKKSSYYKDQSQKGILQILVEQEKKKAATEDAVYDRIGSIFRNMYEKAKPSLRVATAKENAVILLSTHTAQYLYENAKTMGLNTNDNSLKTYVELFIQKAGMNGVDIAIGSRVHSHMISITRKVDNIQPMEIDKINEIGRDPTYFNQYRKALSMKYTQNTDMWNPHLGMEIHKHGYLPYINPEYEKEYNDKLAKALLYMILAGKISYQFLPRSTQKVFWIMKDGKSKMMMHKGIPVSEKNLSALLSWLRMEDDLVEDYSAAFDRMVKEECQKLPLMITRSSKKELLAAITRAPLVSKLRENIFGNVNGVTSSDKRLNLSMLEFAYTIKTSEEASSDCDDGEKILKIGYETLMAFCNHRVASDDLESKLDINYWQVQKFVNAFYNDDTTQAQAEPMEYTKAVFAWANSNGYFRIPDAEGNYFDIDVAALAKAETDDTPAPTEPTV